MKGNLFSKVGINLIVLTI